MNQPDPVRDASAPNHLVRRSVEASIETLARRQHGLVTRDQLLAAGLSLGTIRYRVGQRRLRPVHRGVYGIGPLTGVYAREMAAVLASGTGAVVSHVSAALLWRLLPPGVAAPVDITVVGRDCGHTPGIRAHRVRHMDPKEVTELAGVPLTVVPRTILDLARFVRARELEQAVAYAERHDLTSRAELLSLLERRPRQPGTRALRALLEAARSPAMTRSQAEERLLELIRRVQLPVPELNVRVGPFEVDFLWRTERLIAEVDGFAFHGSRGAFEGDRRRDAQLVSLGYRVIRVTWRQLEQEPDAVLVRIAQALARSAALRL